MKLVDARSGDPVTVGTTVQFRDGFAYRVRHVEEGWFSGRALVENNLEGVKWVPLKVRYFHPQFMFQKVGFIPT